MAPGFFSCCASMSICRFFSRSTSEAGNVGCCTTSARMRERRAEVARQHLEADRRDLALDAAVERDAEIAERALDVQRRARLRAQSIVRIVIAAVPGAPAGSAMAPARVAKLTATFGRSSRSTT